MPRVAKAVAVCFLFPCCVFAQEIAVHPAAGSTPSGQFEITGSAETSVVIPADTAKITFTIEVAAAAANEAYQVGERKLAGVLAAVRKAADEETAVQRRSERYVGANSKAGEITAQTQVRLEIVAAVTTPDLAKVAMLIDAIISGGASSVLDVRYTVERGDGAKNKAVQDAARKAEQQAKAAAASIGAALGKLVSVEVNETPQPTADQADTTASFDDREYSVAVTARYAIEVK